MSALRFSDILAIFITLLSTASICLAEEQSYPDDWTDPNDPTYHNTHALGQIADIANGVQTCEHYDPTLRLILRQMFRELGVDISEKAFFSRKATVSLSSFNMKIVGSYLERETFEDELAVREQVRGALHGMITVDDKEDSTSMWQRLITIIQPWISLLNMMILPPAVFFILRNVMSSRSLLSSIVLLFFIVSMITTYNRMYQQKLAHRIAEAVKRKEDACAPSTLLEQSVEYLTSFFTFRKKSSCVSFIESQTVSIVAEISLLDVFSDVLSNSLFGVLGNLGRHTNRFFREFFDGVPIPVMLLMAIILIFSTVRIKTPLFTFEPLLLTSLRHATTSMIQYIDGPSHGTRANAVEAHRPFIQVGDEDMQASDNHAINRGRNPLRHRRAKATAIPAVSSADTPLPRESSLDSSPSLSSSRSRSLPR
ncbi:unnamed protein product [Cylicocyclus nassatus]|uniref:Chloride channel CLIC-like protein 1 n=1 Tax=Cylicocyclus nassatus TaxID=53992 RepID=A0AA36H8K6_CYLNA|nr:unnamed protein product [Cylicocyclus nassatus]